MLKKKRGDFVQNSLLLVPKYFRRQKNTILSSKIFPTKNVAKKEGGLRTEFNIASSKYFQTQENTIPRSKIFSTKNTGKKQGMSDRNHCYDKKLPHKITIPRSKYFWGQENTNVD